MSKLSRPIRVILSGGGTGGSVRPLLTLADFLHKSNPDWELVFVGTKDGPEREMVAELTWPLKFIVLISGKWRRYFSFKNFLDIFKIIWALRESWVFLKNKPTDLIISAGSFASVPLVWIAGLKKIPVLIHQQDSRPGLANRLMAPFARAITVTFEKSLLDYGPKAIWSGNPLDQESLSQAQSSKVETRSYYNLRTDRPLVLVIGGATGSAGINDLIYQAQSKLTDFCQIIHLSGRGKQPNDIYSVSHLKEGIAQTESFFLGYQTFEFLQNFEVLKLMATADLVVSRSGLSTLTELAALAKPAILIPMPGSHQEDNALIFERAQAAIVLKQTELTVATLTDVILRTLQDPALLQKMANNISKVIKRGAIENMAAVVQEMVKRND